MFCKKRAPRDRTPKERAFVVVSNDGMDIINVQALFLSRRSAIGWVLSRKNRGDYSIIELPLYGAKTGPKMLYANHCQACTNKECGMWHTINANCDGKKFFKPRFVQRK
jgi:hypothetical protein